MPTAVIGDLDFRLLALVDLPIRDVLAVGRPTPRLWQAELFFIDPIEVAVEDVRSRVGRQPTLLMSREIDDVHVAVALLAEHRSVGRELGGSGALTGELSERAANE